MLKLRDEIMKKKRKTPLANNYNNKLYNITITTFIARRVAFIVLFFIYLRDNARMKYSSNSTTVMEKFWEVLIYLYAVTTRSLKENCVLERPSGIISHGFKTINSHAAAFIPIGLQSMKWDETRVFFFFIFFAGILK